MTRYFKHELEFIIIIWTVRLLGLQALDTINSEHNTYGTIILSEFPVWKSEF